ncbi:heparan-alpha-glucosaminide N-acetyltransferase-like isoform X7 [Mercenaria mercenaria]|uniref:heparan-alpha-glucosaminide N-acetyltransferase-like isoform X7 n=1 Tax=Mercenaria mercenaria TaxID=6596 RepID=UPI00234EAA61|nr:heparan-alpha-glucosaminide N-acetyltransferase-like isoform X7 [Mercenaria mercenaria]
MTGCKMDDGGKLNFKTLYFFCLLVCLSLGNEEKDPKKVCKHVPQKKIDTAFVTVETHGHKNVTVNLNTITTECYTCDLQLTAVVEPHHNTCTVLVDTRWKMKVSISTDNDSFKVLPSCSVNNLSKWFLEGGNYSIIVMIENDKITCEKPVLQNDTVDSNIPIYVAMGAFVGLVLLWWLLKYMYRNHLLRRLQYCLFPDSAAFIDPNEYAEQDLGVPTNTSEEDAVRPRKERLKSLDTFRGFVWIMGTAMAYSFHSQLRRSTPKTKMFWKIFKRSCILFALGLLINSSDGLNPVRMREFRIPGVLQRFAGTYLIVATLHMFFAKPNDPNQYTWWSPIRDITDYWFEWVFNIVLVVVWLALTFGLEVPGCPKGYLGPGGLANDSDGKNVSLCTGGAASYIDRTIFGKGRIYQTPTCKEIYLTTVPHDPEGLLGTLTSCFMCFLGLQAGKILRTFPDWKQRVKRFIIWGIILGVIAVILCKGEKNGGFIPINKNLWSLSFVICLSCFAFFLFAFCYVTIDVYRVWSGAPFYYPGMNAILLYMGHEFFSQPFRTFLGIQPNSHMVYLPINIWDTAVWIILSYYLYYKEIFFSV